MLAEMLPSLKYAFKSPIALCYIELPTPERLSNVLRRKIKVSNKKTLQLHVLIHVYLFAEACWRCYADVARAQEYQGRARAARTPRGQRPRTLDDTLYYYTVLLLLSYYIINYNY